MRWTWCVVLTCVLGCGSGAPDCKQAVDKVLAATGEKDKSIGDAITAECEKQKWSAEVRTCLGNAKSDKDAEACMMKVEGAADRAAKAQQAAEEAKARAAAAEQAAQQAVKDAQAAKDKLDAVEKDLDDLNAKISAAVTSLADAHNNADREAAKAKLLALQKEQADLKARAAAAKADAMKAERTKGVHVSKECLDNPLAKGCQ